MATSLALIPATNSTIAVRNLEKSALGYIAHAKAERTIKAYRSDFKHFERFCEQHNVSALPATPDTIALYLTSLADQGFKVATISRRVAAISKAHSAAGYDAPTAMRHACVKEVWAGI